MDSRPVTSSTPASRPVRRFLAVVGLPAVVLLFGTLTYDATRTTTETRRRVDRSHQAVEAADAVLADLTEAESAQRGYLLTGDQSFLPAYRAARGRIPADLNRLAVLSDRASGSRAWALDTLRTLAGERLAALERGVGARELGERTTSLALLRTGRDEAIMRSVRSSVARLASDERHGLARASAMEQARTERTLVVLVAGTLAAGGLALIVTILLTGEARTLGVALAERDRALAGAREASERLREQSEALAATNATLRASETRLEIAMEAGGLGWWEWHVASARVQWSPKLERVFGLRPGEFDGTIQAFRAHVHPDDRDAVAAAGRRMMEGSGSDYYTKFRIIRPDGEVCWVEARAAVLRDAAGAPLRLLGVAGDVTARETAEQERRLLTERAEAARRDAEQARTEAERASHAKSEFLATMSHELRTPLNAIQGYAELMTLGIRGPVTEAQRDDLARIRRASRHLLALINDILNYAKLEAGRVEVRLDDVPLGDVVRDVDALVAPQMAARSLRFVVDVAAGGLAVRGDPEKVRQILVNLLTNAIKFTEGGGVVTLGATATDEAVTLSVTDTGRGIPPDRLDQIFDPFVQVDRHLTDGGQQGVGLGLAISRDLARAMGGELTAESEPGRGSTFRVRLPRVAGSAAVITPRSLPPAPAPAARAT